jgi:hypothetical protein
MPNLRIATLLVFLLLVDGCSWICGESRSPLRIRPGDVIESHTQGRLSSTARIAVMPFHGETKAGNVNGVPGRDEKDAALVGKFFSESKRDFGIKVISPHDMALAFAAAGQPVPILDPVESAASARKNFAADGVGLGRLLRYRERDGSAAARKEPARVSFKFTIYDVETGRRLWRGRFNQTQKTLTENILLARQYPGPPERNG